MTNGAAAPPKVPLGRLAILTIVLLVGLGLYFLFARRTPVVVHPAESEVSP